MDKFKFPVVDDTSDEIDDELEYYTDDSWQDFDPGDEGYDDDEVHDLMEQEEWEEGND